MSKLSLRGLLSPIAAAQEGHGGFLSHRALMNLTCLYQRRDLLQGECLLDALQTCRIEHI